MAKGTNNQQKGRGHPVGPGATTYEFTDGAKQVVHTSPSNVFNEAGSSLILEANDPGGSPPESGNKKTGEPLSNNEMLELGKRVYTVYKGESNKGFPVLKAAHGALIWIGRIFRKEDPGDILDPRSKKQKDTAAGAVTVGAGASAILTTVTLWKPLALAFKLSGLKWFCKLGFYPFLLGLNQAFTAPGAKVFTDLLIFKSTQSHVTIIIGAGIWSVLSFIVAVIVYFALFAGISWFCYSAARYFNQENLGEQNDSDLEEVLRKIRSTDKAFPSSQHQYVGA